MFLQASQALCETCVGCYYVERYEGHGRYQNQGVTEVDLRAL